MPASKSKHTPFTSSCREEKSHLSRSKRAVHNETIDEFHRKASKLLLVGNLDVSVSEEDLLKKFSKFGDIIDVDISPSTHSTNIYEALVQFCDIKSVVRALKYPASIIIQRREVTLNFGKSSITNCLWLDELPMNITEKLIREEFCELGGVEDVILDHSFMRALVYFKNSSIAHKALKYIKEKFFLGHKVQVDYAGYQCQNLFKTRVPQDFSWNNFDDSSRKKQHSNNSSHGDISVVGLLQQENKSVSSAYFSSEDRYSITSTHGHWNSIKSPSTEIISNSPTPKMSDSTPSPDICDFALDDSNPSRQTFFSTTTNTTTPTSLIRNNSRPSIKSIENKWKPFPTSLNSSTGFTHEQFHALKVPLSVNTHVISETVSTSGYISPEEDSCSSTVSPTGSFLPQMNHFNNSNSGGGGGGGILHSKKSESSSSIKLHHHHHHQSHHSHPSQLNYSSDSFTTVASPSNFTKSNSNKFRGGGIGIGSSSGGLLDSINKQQQQSKTTSSTSSSSSSSLLKRSRQHHLMKSSQHSPDSSDLLFDHHHPLHHHNRFSPSFDDIFNESDDFDGSTTAGESMYDKIKRRASKSSGKNGSIIIDDIGYCNADDDRMMITTNNTNNNLLGKRKKSGGRRKMSSSKKLLLQQQQQQSTIDSFCCEKIQKEKRKLSTNSQQQNHHHSQGTRLLMTTKSSPLTSSSSINSSYHSEKLALSSSSITAASNNNNQQSTTTNINYNDKYFKKSNIPPTLSSNTIYSTSNQQHHFSSSSSSSNNKTSTNNLIENSIENNNKKSFLTVNSVFCATPSTSEDEGDISHDDGGLFGAEMKYDYDVPTPSTLAMDGSTTDREDAEDFWPEINKIKNNSIPETTTNNNNNNNNNDTIKLSSTQIKKQSIVEKMEDVVMQKSFSPSSSTVSSLLQFSSPSLSLQENIMIKEDIVTTTAATTTVDTVASSSVAATVHTEEKDENANSSYAIENYSFRPDCVGDILLTSSPKSLSHLPSFSFTTSSDEIPSQSVVSSCSIDPPTTIISNTNTTTQISSLPPPPSSLPIPPPPPPPPPTTTTITTTAAVPVMEINQSSNSSNSTFSLSHCVPSLPGVNVCTPVLSESIVPMAPAVTTTITISSTSSSSAAAATTATVATTTTSTTKVDLMTPTTIHVEESKTTEHIPAAALELLLTSTSNKEDINHPPPPPAPHHHPPPPLPPHSHHQEKESNYKRKLKISQRPKNTCPNIPTTTTTVTTTTITPATVPATVASSSLSLSSSTTKEHPLSHESAQKLNDTINCIVRQAILVDEMDNNNLMTITTTTTSSSTTITSTPASLHKEIIMEDSNHTTIGSLTQVNTEPSEVDPYEPNFIDSPHTSSQTTTTATSCSSRSKATNKGKKRGLTHSSESTAGTTTSTASAVASKKKAIQNSFLDIIEEVAQGNFDEEIHLRLLGCDKYYSEHETSLDGESIMTTYGMNDEEKSCSLSHSSDLPPSTNAAASSSSLSMAQHQTSTTNFLPPISSSSTFSSSSSTSSSSTSVPLIPTQPPSSSSTSSSSSQNPSISVMVPSSLLCATPVQLLHASSYLFPQEISQAVAAAAAVSACSSSSTSSQIMTDNSTTSTTNNNNNNSTPSSILSLQNYCFPGLSSSTIADNNNTNGGGGCGGSSGFLSSSNSTAAAAAAVAAAAYNSPTELFYSPELVQSLYQFTSLPSLLPSLAAENTAYHSHSHPSQHPQHPHHHSHHHQAIMDNFLQQQQQQEHQVLASLLANAYKNSMQTSPQNPFTRQDTSSAEDSESTFDESSLISNDQFIDAAYANVWQGRLSLKNEDILVNMHHVHGSTLLIDACLEFAGMSELVSSAMKENSKTPKQKQAQQHHHHTNPSSPSSTTTNTNTTTSSLAPPLKIVQRMRLEESQLEGVYKKMQTDFDHCSCIAVASGRTSAEKLQMNIGLTNSFIKYMQEKSAAGIINVCNPETHQGLYVIHIFPPCDFSNKHLQASAPKLFMQLTRERIPYLLVVITTV